MTQAVGGAGELGAGGCGGPQEERRNAEGPLSLWARSKKGAVHWGHHENFTQRQNPCHTFMFVFGVHRGTILSPVLCPLKSSSESGETSG